MEARSELEHLSNAKYNILSAQTNKSEMVIVQDSLLGAYKMTHKIQPMSKGDFMQCMMSISHDYDYHDRLEVINFLFKKHNPSNKYQYFTHALFGFIFPSDFHITYDNDSGLKIVNGVVVSGYFDKFSLKSESNSLIRVLCMEYGPDITSTFIDNIQFLTNCWLTINPFSVGIQDCLIDDDAKHKEIKDTVQKYFLEANKVSTSTDHPQIRESRVNCSLNKAKDIGLKIAKNALRPNNNFISTVTSGSKGDYFNIAQITGLLGQQNLEGKRPIPTIDNRKRTLIHYPRVIVNDAARKYRSRGFVASSFIEGMKPDEMFFHAMTGREGMTKTAMGTATSGYIQRSIVKLNEDLKIEYDGTVRDARKNIYQHAFGNHGFDLCKVNINEKKDIVQPVDIERLTNRLNNGCFRSIREKEEEKEEEKKLVKLKQSEIEEIIIACRRSTNIPQEIADQIQNKQDKILRTELEKVKLISGKYNEFKNFIVTKYHSAQASPGECVGIIGAQSIGERQTQTTLNTFHTAGKLQQSGVGRLEEILNMTKKLKIKTCVLYFKEQYKTSDDLRKALNCTLTGLYFSDLYTDEPETYFDPSNENDIVLEFNFNPKILYINHLNTFKIATAVNDMITSVLDCQCSVSIKPTGIIVRFSDKQKTFNDYQTALDKILVCGMKGVVASHLDHDGKEWLVVTEGSNLKKMLAHPLIDNKRLYCNDFWEVYEALGIAAVRKMLLQDLKNAVCGVNTAHVQLLVDKMTFKGKPCSITRYTMRSNDVGPLSKATFEESTDILLNAAMKTEIENNAGVSAAIVSGNQPRAGTGFMNLLIDYQKLINNNKIDEKIDEIDENIDELDENIDENNNEIDNEIDNEPTQVYYC